MKTRNALAAALACAVAGTVTFAKTAHPPGGHQAGQARSAGKATARAHATISGEGVTGTADIVEMAYDTGTEVEVTVTAKGLKPGLHGVHFHAVGKCEPPAFTAAGGHFDPGPAGNTDPDVNHPYHLGDIPNLRVGAEGSGTLQARTTRVTVSAGPLSLMDADGSAIIIHANPDQGITGEAKSGVSGGPRAACGVIEKK
ncbi:MAG TPA: superoxide dismutase family protein [Vicinamibacterales bacterium]|nr:superoxide dismutase family protein [Vicinamibacterales bacterium]